MSAGEKYTAAAYLVVFLGVLAYVLIIAAKLQRLQREVTELVETLREREGTTSTARIEATRVEPGPVEAGSADG